MEHEEEDPVEALARIKARGRARTQSRMLRSAAAVLPAILIWAIATPFIGWLFGAFVGGVVGAAVAKTVDRKWPE